MNIQDRITDYLSAGGLFNPEMMEHDKVRELIMDARTELSRLKEERRWIPVSERLPDVHRRVLTFDGRLREVDELVESVFGKTQSYPLVPPHFIFKQANYEGRKVTHWSTLTPPPEPTEAVPSTSDDSANQKVVGAAPRCEEFREGSD